MQLNCPHCQAVWDFSDRRPAFCPFCGKAVPKAADGDATTPFEPPAPIRAPDPRPDSEAATRAADPPPTAAVAADPETIGGYRLLRVLGIGGMGKVYEAQDAATGRRVALKLVSADYASSAAAVERFRQEGQLASRIAHPRCVFVVAADEDAGRPYIVMELMPGDNLDDHIRHWKTLPPGKAVALILDVMEGLQEAHRVGVVHRDVKPSNCFFGHDGRLKVGDFGLAKSLAQGTHLTKTGSFLGTPLYASPEQVRGEATIDAQTDVYSVAATLYFLLTGRAPFQSDNPVTTLARIAADPAPPMRTLKPELPLELDEVVLRGLERDRKRRWRTIDEFAEALRPFLPGKASEAGPIVRIAALVIDLVLFYLLDYGLAWLADYLGAANLGKRDRLGDLLPLGNPLLLLLYFTFTEGFGGCSPGKRLLGLRIRNAATAGPAGLRRVLGRAALFALFFYLGTVFTAGSLLVLARAPSSLGAQAYATRMDDYPLLTVLPEVGFLLGVVLFVCSMRTRNGYRGLHEVLSGTRVVRLPRAGRRGTARSHVGRKQTTPQPAARDSAASRPTGLPDKIGAFDVRGQLCWTDSAKVLLGFDAGLGRPAVLWLRPAAEPALSATRRELDRTTRLRWLAAGKLAEYRWDAFLAPDGGPLLALHEAGGRISWARFQPLLIQLTVELRQALREEILPAQPGPAFVWVRPDEGITLLEFPLDDASASPATAFIDPEKQALALLARVAVSSLEGRPAPAELPAAVRVPLPGSVADLLRVLLAHGRTGLPLRVFQKRLRYLDGIPPEVTRKRRAGQLALVGAFLFLTFGCCLPSLSVFSQIHGAMQAYSLSDRDEEAIDDLNTAAVRDYLRGATSTDPLVRASAVAPLGQDGPLRAQIQAALDLRRQRTDEGGTWGTPFYRDNLLPKTALERVRPPLSSLSGFTRRHVATAFAGTIDARARESLGHLQQANEWDVLELAAHLVSFAAGPLLWVLGILALRRDLSYVVADVDIVRADGRPAGRLRCAARALLVWAPFGLMLVLGFGLNDWCWAHWDGQWPAPFALPLLALILFWGAWVVLLFHVGLTLAFPRRGLHDYLAGTYLVPG